MNIINNLPHKFNCFLGKEVDVIKHEAGTPHVKSHNLHTGEVKGLHEGTDPKTTSTYKKVMPPSPPKETKKAKLPKINVLNGFKFSIRLEVLLLVIRHFAPEVAEELPAVYKFLDAVMLPVINWLYAVAMNLIQFVVEWPWVQAILEWLQNLA